MRENRLSGSEGGGAAKPALPTPIQGAFGTGIFQTADKVAPRSTIRIDGATWQAAHQEQKDERENTNCVVDYHAGHCGR